MPPRPRWRWHPEFLRRSTERLLLDFLDRPFPDWSSPDAEFLRVGEWLPNSGTPFPWWSPEYDAVPTEAARGEHLCAWGIRGGFVSLSNWAATKEVIAPSLELQERLVHQPLLDPLGEDGPTLYVVLPRPWAHVPVPESPQVEVIGLYMSLQKGMFLLQMQEVCPDLPTFAYGLMLHPIAYGQDEIPGWNLDPLLRTYEQIFCLARSLYLLHQRQTSLGETWLLPGTDRRPSLRRDSPSRREREAARDRLPWTWRIGVADLPEKLVRLRRPSVAPPRNPSGEDRAPPGRHHVAPFVRRVWVREPSPGEEPLDIKAGEGSPYLFQVARPVAEATGGFWRGEGRTKTVRALRVEE